MSFTQGLGIWRNKMKNIMMLNLSKPVEHLVLRDKMYHKKSVLHSPDTPTGSPSSITAWNEQFRGNFGTVVYHDTNKTISGPWHAAFQWGVRRPDFPCHGKSPNREKYGSWHAADTSRVMKHDTPGFARILEEYGSVSWDFRATTRRFSRSG